MRRLIEVAQGSREWIWARRGTPTASNASSILTSGGKSAYSTEGKALYKPSTGRDRYLAELLCEWFIGMQDQPKSLPMLRGNVLEEEAADWFEWDQDTPTELTGLHVVDLPTGCYGASPDRLIPSRKRLLQIKCPGAVQHMKYLTGADSILAEHRPQLMQELLVIGPEWEGVDLLSYHPQLPHVLVRVDRDERYIAELEQLLTLFCGDLELHKERLIDKGYRIVEPLAIPEEREYPEFISDEDVERVIEGQRNA